MNIFSSIPASSPLTRSSIFDADCCVSCHKDRADHVVARLGGVEVLRCPDPPTPDTRGVRQFDTGATRNLESNKYDYEGFLSPLVLEKYAEYMHSHRKQKDGTLRDSDNWQMGIPQHVYVKSLVRHTMDFWRLSRGGKVVDPDTGKEVQPSELACAIMFNVMGWLYEELRPRVD